MVADALIPIGYLEKTNVSAVYQENIITCHPNSIPDCLLVCLNDEAI